MDRIYILVPETVQTISESYGGGDFLENSIKIEPGRLMAQCCHVGRKLEKEWSTQPEYLDSFYQEITTIVLSVRNSKELNKVTNELEEWLGNFDPEDINPIQCVRFYDVNNEFYLTYDKIHTATAIGPVTQEMMDPIIGHLELYR